MKKILVIDDEPPVARLISAALKAARVEHTVEYCGDGGQGKIKAAQGGYDLITLDLSMPLMDGIEALQQMKWNPKSAGIPVVVITSREEPDLEQRMLALGAAAFVAKPFRPNELSRILQQVLAGELPARPEAEGMRPLGG